MHPLIRQYYQAFNSGDREALLALLHPDIVHEINEGGVETIDNFTDCTQINISDFELVFSTF